MTQDELKARVAREALKHVVEDAVVGVGSGSTVNFFIDALAGIKGRIEGAVAASEASAERLKKHGIRVFDLNSVDELPVYVDGADEVTAHLTMIKGGGGALTRDGARWRSAKRGFLFPVRALSRVFRGKYLDGLRRDGKWNGDPPPPTLPPDVVQATSTRYRDAYRRVTGREVEA